MDPQHQRVHSTEQHGPEVRSGPARRVALVLGARHNFWLDQRVLRTARALMSGGFAVLAYTPTASARDERPIEGVVAKYIRVPGAGSGLFRRFLLDYLLYNVPVAFNIRRSRVDICHCNDFDTLPAGALAKILSLGRMRLVYDSHEDYPLFVEEHYGKALARVIAVAERIVASLFVDRVVAVNETITARFAARGFQSETVMNCQDLLTDERACSGREGINEGDAFTVAYQGNVITMRGYEQLIEAADILINTRKMTDLRFLIMGKSLPDVSYGEGIEKAVAEKGLSDHFVFTGFLEHSEMMWKLRCADVGLLLFQPTPHNRLGLPNKLFENFAAGIPTVASDFPEIARVISEEKCGLLVDPTQPGEIADAIQRLYCERDLRLEMGTNALNAARTKYNFEAQAKKLLNLYAGLK